MSLSVIVVLKAALVCLFAYFLVFAAVFFVSAQLLPQTLSGVYAHLPNSFWRAVVAGIVFLPFGNWVMSYAFGQYGPALVAPMLVIAMVLANMTYTLLVYNLKPSLWLIPALLSLCASGVWISLLLQKAAK
jgi:hypothetical protein